jgi:hypothetical protein
VIGGTAWWLVTVYGPQPDAEKVVFLDELRGLQPLCDEPWLLCGDFNLIYMASDKSNPRLNHPMMGKFHRFLQDMESSKVHLHGRLFTWSNEQAHPTLSRIDKAFACIAWCDIFPHYHLRAGSSAVTDHAPLLLYTNICAVAKKRFRFETIWPKFPGYLDAMSRAWHDVVPNANPFCTLDCKLRRTANALKSWSAKFVGSVRLQLAVAKEVILQFDRQQDRCLLSPEEGALRKGLKVKCLGLAALQCTIAR